MAKIIPFFILFGLSGFSGLIYESIWSHYLKLLLGHAAYAQTLVLVIFMGGMAFGAGWVGRYSTRWPNLLLAYAAVEAIIGIFGMGFHPLFLKLVDGLYAAWLPSLSNPLTITLFKWSLGALLILPQSLLLGATFPLMSGGLARLLPQSIGSLLGMLYFTNSLGAAIGVLVSVFILIPLMGLPGTILTAGLINIFLALVVWQLSKFHAPMAAASLPRHPAAQDVFSMKALLLIAGVSSAASFLYEIGWIRMLCLVLGSSMQAFELMLSAFILGLACGGWWIRSRLDNLDEPLRFAAGVQIFMGLCALATLPLYNYTFDFMGFFLQSLAQNESAYTLFQWGSHGIAVAIMLPATFFAGMTLPLFTQAMIRQGQGESSIGFVYAANTLGAIVGVLLAVHWLMPSLGVKNVVGLGALMDIGVAGGLFLLSPTSRPVAFGRAKYAAICILALALLMGVQFDPLRMASGVFRSKLGRLPEKFTSQFHRDGSTASVDLINNNDQGLSIATNGKIDASISFVSEKPMPDEPTQVLLGLLPLMAYPEAKTAAIIGFGSGMTTHTLLGGSRLQQVDVVEIEPAIVEAAHYFGPAVERAFTDPRSHVHIEDAKTYFSSRSERYDIIISEPSNPWVSGVANLFSREFYQHIQSHLSEKGLLLQWMHLYEIGIPQLASVFQALALHFRDYRVFLINAGDIMILAGNNGDLDRLDPWVFALDSLRTELLRANISSPVDIQFRHLGGRAALQPYFNTSGAPVNSDFFPYLSLTAPRSRFLGSSGQELAKLQTAPMPIMEILDKQPRISEPATSKLTGKQFNYPVADIYHQARYALQVFREHKSPDRLALGGLIFPVELLRKELGCADPQPPQDDVVRETLQDLASTINALLSTQDASALWDAIEQLPGFARLSQETRDWFILHRAAGRRDPATLVLQAGRMLDKPEFLKNLQGTSRDYFLMAGLTGYLGQGDQSGARGFIKRLVDAKAFPPSEQWPVPLRLLVSLAG